MRKITKESVNAFYRSIPFKKSNTQVVVKKDKTELKLHSHTIATLYKDKTLEIDSCGWMTHTTKERLNGLNNVGIYQKNYEWFLNGKIWNGKKIIV